MPKKPKVVALLPARLESSRLPRKALVDICGLPMIVHVYRRCLLAKTLDAVYVATDSDEIRRVVEAHGGKVVMTAKTHETGTDRIAEAAATMDADIIVNVQGDEALVNPGHIDAVVSAVRDDPAVNVGILVNPYSKRNSPSDIKAVLNEKNDVMYLSRNDIPSDARTPNATMLKAYHIVPFRRDFLLKYAAWEKGLLERVEFNEYLRILEKGYTIRAVQVESDAVSVDTAHDLEYVRSRMLRDPFFPLYSGNGSRTRAVVLQTAKQVKHYAEKKRREDDLVIPIGPEAMYLAEEHGWATCRLGGLWSPEEYEQASKESQSRIDNLIGALDAYSLCWNPGLELELGRYYALQIWVIIGQIHYNQFIARSIRQRLQPASLLVYTKAECEPFLELRPDPDCIFADVLLHSGCKDASPMEVLRLAESRKGRSLREWVVNLLSPKWLVRFREVRDRWRIRGSGDRARRLLLIGGGYDWFKISRHQAFSANFSLHIVPRLMSRAKATPPAELVSILDNSVREADGTVACDVTRLASAMQADILLFANKHEELKKELRRYDALVAGVLTYPWDNYLAHIAAKMNIPVVVWQHGEKGQTEDVVTQYSELSYATDYLAYAPAVCRQYQTWIGKRRLARVRTVGSLGKHVAWRGGDAIVYATGKWFKTAVPFLPKSDPDGRLFGAHKAILEYLDEVATERPVVFKANNTSGLNDIPYHLAQVRIDYATPFTELLQTAGAVILDTPATTLVEACSTTVPVFVLGGRSEYLPEFLEMVKRRVVWCETPEELIGKVDAYLADGIYAADVNDDTYLREYCAFSEPNGVVKHVRESLLHAIRACGGNGQL